MRYLIFGSGFIGNKFKEFLPDSGISKTDITNYEKVKEVLKEFDPEIVINCAGKTGKPHIDWCESHKIETLSSNVTGPLTLLRVCQELNKYLVHMGSGCIYAGPPDRFFTEEDEPNFSGSFYSRTKLYVEKLLKDFDVLQLRIRIPVDTIPGPKNIITKLITYKEIIDVSNSMTVISDFLPVAKQLIDKKEIGIFNVVNKGAMAYRDVLDLYEKISGKKLDYKLISVEELYKKVKAERSTCALSVEKLEKLGIGVRDIKVAMEDTIKEYVKHEVV